MYELISIICPYVQYINMLLFIDTLDCGSLYQNESTISIRASTVYNSYTFSLRIQDQKLAFFRKLLKYKHIFKDT